MWAVRIKTIVLLLCILPLIAHAGEDWTTLQGNRYHTGVAPKGTITMPLAVHPTWSTQVAVGPLRQAAVVNGRVYVTSTNGVWQRPERCNLWCLDGKTGEIAWQTDVGDDFNGMPTYADGKIYVQRSSAVLCVDTGTGDLQWTATYPAQWQTYPVPTVYDTKLLIEGGTYSGLYCVDLPSQSKDWFITAAQYPGWAPVAHNGTTYVYLNGYFARIAMDDGHLIDVTDVFGRTVAAEPASATNPYSIALDTANGIALAPIGGSLTVLDYGTPNVLWQVFAGLRFITVIPLLHGVDAVAEQTPSVYNGEVFLRDSGQLVIYDEFIGEEKWRFEGDTWLPFNLAISDGYLFASGKEKVWVIDIETRQVRWVWLNMSGHLSIGNNGLVVTTMDGWVHYFQGRIPTEVQEVKDAELPGTFSLSQNYPNPFNPSTTIEFSLPSRSHVKLDVLNVLGQHVATLANEELGAGQYYAIWDGTDDSGASVSSGVYFYRLTTDQYSESRKMMLLK